MADPEPKSDPAQPRCGGKNSRQASVSAHKVQAVSSYPGLPPMLNDTQNGLQEHLITVSDDVSNNQLFGLSSDLVA